MSYPYRYMHVERLGNAEVEGILNGNCYIFPKIDGANAVILSEDGVIKCYSRNNEIRNKEHNANFAKLYELAHSEKMQQFFNDYPTMVLYGEWLIPHSIKYKSYYYNRFYVFDVYEKCTESFISFDVYKNILNKYEIDYLIYLSCATTWHITEGYLDELSQHRVMLDDSQEYSEGIVIKNYEFKNKYGVHWAKYLNKQFIEKKGIKLSKPKFEKSIAERNFVSSNLSISEIDKEKNKIIIENGKWQNNFIPQLQENVYKAFIQDFDCDGFDSRFLRSEVNRLVAMNSKE